jgi:hypothetical protein
MYVIKRKDGLYVAKPGSQRSYTNRLENARKFAAREEAERDLCPDNERIVPLSECL